MSVLNTASDGFFNVLVSLVRTSVDGGAMPREQLLAATGARASGIEAQRLNQTLTRWTELGLFTELDKRVEITADWRAGLGKTADDAEARLPKVLRRIALNADNNMRFWESEESRSADLTRGLSWLLAQNVYAFDASNHDRVSNVEIGQIVDPSQRIVQNDVRWNGLRVWATYLGFAREDQQFTIDPTRAVRDHLPDVFAGQGVLTGPQFLERLKDELPVLDGGTLRTKVEAVLDTQRWHRPPDGMVSTSLSRALRRLEASQTIALETRADTQEGILLTGLKGRLWGRVTHVRPVEVRV